MMASRMMRSRSWRKGQSKGDAIASKKQGNVEEILAELNSKPTTAARRLALLNALAKLMQNSVKDEQSLYSTEELLISLRTSMVHDFTQVRAGVLRALRYTLKNSRDVQIFNELQLPQLLCRSVDIIVDNEEERIQAFKLVRKILSVSPEQMSPLITRSLVSSSESGIEEGDRMLRACLAVLCEIGVLNPLLMIVCGGVNSITRTVLECHSPRIAESLCGVLLHLLEWPQTRNISGVRLDCLAAPYCDFTYRLGIMDKNKHARDLRFTCSRLALLSVLRSWPGILEFCDPNKKSGLKAIVDVLYLNQVEVRKAILDLFYELLWLPQPVWTDEYSVAIAAIDPADYQDAWRLGEGFVAMEGRHVLPSLASRVPNISEIHTSILLYCFLETGLLEALIGVVVSSAAFISVRATILIGKILHLMHTHLPADICSASSALPALISYASQGNSQASAAISALHSLHKVLQNRPASCSLFLDTIIQSGPIVNSPIFKREIELNDTSTQQSQYGGMMERSRYDSVGSSTSNSGDEPNSQTLNRRGSMRKKQKFLQLIDGLRPNENLINESNVFANDDGKTWDWEIITTIFTRTNANNKMDTRLVKLLRRLMHFFKPSSNRFSHQDVGLGRILPAYVTAGIKLIDWLLKNAEMESIRLLTDYFSDIDAQLLAICTAKSAHDCLFSPQHMTSTMCQFYFLYIGRMCRSKIGINILINTHIFKHLIQIVTETNHICYIKLIVSGLDYTTDALPRQVLEKALTASERSAGRLYATQFMLVLLRAKIPNFEVWGLPLLIKQTRDKERKVILAALAILDEACHERTYLEEIVSLWPDFTSRGDNGKLLMSRYYSIPRGLNHTKARIQQEIEIWLNVYNKRYVLLIEADTHAHMTLHTRSEDGTYSRRACSTREITIPPNILPHLYGQLVQTTQGLENLLKFGQLQHLIETLIQGKCSNESETLLLKAAIWALGHTSTSTDGVEFLNETAPSVFEKFIYLAKHCEVYSVRAVALNALGLIGTTKTGADILYKYDWLCIRHNRDTIWPVYETEDWISKHLTPIRHHLDSVPPYNYTGIDEKISGIFDISTSSMLPESGDISKTDTISEVDGVLPASTKSRTLPEYACKYTNPKHKRSLSESKTTDGICLVTNHNVSRTRFNSGTDSNTSGVSSYESVFGIVMGDLCKTLSPIQSSSNLLEVKKPNERFRRGSLVGAMSRDSTLSAQDAIGYATLRSIRRNQRPQLSESAADDLAEIMDGQSRPNNRLAVAQPLRRMKVRSLDRNSTFDAIDSDGSHDMSRVTDIGSYYLSNTGYTRGPSYSGICLPKNIMDLFPGSKTSGTYVTRCIKDPDSVDLVLKHGVIADFISECDEYSVSSLSDISSTTSKRSKLNGGRHNRNACLFCCRTTQGINRFNLTTVVSNIGTVSNSSDVELSGGSSNALTATPNRKPPELANLDTTFNSSESHLSDDNNCEKTQENILRHVQRMANPVWSKQSKMALYKIKQKNPQAFRSICLYSDVCVALSQNTYRFSSRRFLQEIFADVDYSSFYTDAFEIVGRKKELIDSRDNHNDDSSEVDTVDCVTTNDVQTSSANSSPTAASLAEKVRMMNYTNPIPSSAMMSHPIKTHLLKSPPLASVYETSRENLSDSLGAHSKSILNSTPIGNDIGKHRLQAEVDIEIIPHTQQLEKGSTTKNDLGMNNHSRTVRSVLVNENRQSSTYSRPRFNTLELDLSCTKNKFPITDRRKTLDSSSSISNSALYSKRIIKSLSASITTAPSMSLYCEKRLQTSKSEAILPIIAINNNTTHNSVGICNHNSENQYLAK